MPPRRKKQPHPPRIARHIAPAMPKHAHAPPPRHARRVNGARCGIVSLIVFMIVVQLSHLPFLSRHRAESGVLGRLWGATRQRARTYGLSTGISVAQRACTKCDATHLHIAVRSDLSREGAERRLGARRSWLRWLRGLDGVSYAFFVVDAPNANRTGLLHDLGEEAELYDDIRNDDGRHYVEAGKDLAPELRVFSEALRTKQTSHFLATDDRSLPCVHRIREEIRKRPLFQFAWTKYRCVAPWGGDAAPPLELEPGFFLVTRDVAQLLSKLSEAGHRSIDVAALLPLLSVTVLDDQTRLASPSSTSDHVQLLYDQTRQNAFRPKQQHFCQKYVAALDVARPWAPATPAPTLKPTPKPSHPQPTRGALSLSAENRRKRKDRQSLRRGEAPVEEERSWLQRLWTGRRLTTAGFFELVDAPMAHHTDDARALPMAPDDDDAPRAPRLAPDDDDGEDVHDWLDANKVPAHDWLDAGVDAEPSSGDEVDDDKGDDGVNLDLGGDDTPKLRGSLNDDRLQRLQAMREKLLGKETAAKLLVMQQPPKMAGGRSSDDDAPVLKKKPWSLFGFGKTPKVEEPLVPASARITKPGELRSLVFGTMGLQGGTSLSWNVGAPAYAALGALCGTPPLRTFRGNRVPEAQALKRRDAYRRSVTAGVVDTARRTRVAALLVERFTATASEVQLAQVQPRLMACSFQVDCLLPAVSSTIVKLWWAELRTPFLEKCCPERAFTLKVCGQYQTRTFRPENTTAAVLASFPGSGNTWTRLLLEHASGFYTGSVYDDVDLMRLLPAEGVDSGAVLAVKAHLNPAKYLPQIRGDDERIILLVRHPFDAIWSEYNRRTAGGHANAAGEFDIKSPKFAMFARCMGCKWMRYAMMHADLAASGRQVRVLRYEDLVKSTEPTLRAMLQFLDITDVDTDRIRCAQRLSDDPSVKRVKKRSATALMGNFTPSLACGLWAQISNNAHARLLLNTMGYSAPGACPPNPSSSFFCDLEDVSAMSEGRGDNCGGNLASPLGARRPKRTSTYVRPRVTHVRGTAAPPRETALDRARARAAAQRTARNAGRAEKPVAGSYLAAQERAEAVRRRRAKKKKKRAAAN